MKKTRSISIVGLKSGFDTLTRSLVEDGHRKAFERHWSKDSAFACGGLEHVLSFLATLSEKEHALLKQTISRLGPCPMVKTATFATEPITYT